MLSVTTDRELGGHDGIERLFLYARDREDESIAMLFNPACEFVDCAKRAGCRVMVHCVAGRSRSATLVIAYLMRSMRMTLIDAFFLVKSRRPIVFPNVGFWKQLMNEEVQLFGATNRSPVPSCYEQLFTIFREELEISPKKVFKQYLVASTLDDAEYSQEQKIQTLDGCPSIWPASKIIEDVIMCSIEQTQSDARALAVEFISGLLFRSNFTHSEVVESLSLLQGLDLEDLRMDNPKVDEYIAQIVQAAQARGLPCGGWRS